MPSMSMPSTAIFSAGLGPIKRIDLQQRTTLLTLTVMAYPQRKIWQFVLCYHHIDLSEVDGSRKTSMRKRNPSRRAKGRTPAQAVLNFQACSTINTLQRHQVPWHGARAPHPTTSGPPLRLLLHQKHPTPIRRQQRVSWLLKVPNEQISKCHGALTPQKLRHQHIRNQPLPPAAASQQILRLMNQSPHALLRTNHRTVPRENIRPQSRAHGHPRLVVGPASYEGGRPAIALCKTDLFQPFPPIRLSRTRRQRRWPPQ